MSKMTVHANFRDKPTLLAAVFDHRRKTIRLPDLPVGSNLNLSLDACLAVPRGEDLKLYVSTQIVDAVRACVASTLKIDPQRIRVVSPYVGGGFGPSLGSRDTQLFGLPSCRSVWC